MKYLIRYNESRTNEEEISKYINWDLINLSKDISLELLDDGYVVNLEIRYPKMNTYDTNDSKYILYEEDWEHDGEDSRPWKLSSVNQVLNMGPVDKEDFIYIFGIYKFDMYNPSLPNGVMELDKERMIEFISQLKDFFPDNNIKINSAMY